MKRALVVGGTGTVGASLGPDLQRRGHEVRIATRTPRRSDHVRLDLVTGEGRESAVTGIDALFLMSPPGHLFQHRLLNPVVDAAADRGVKKIVLLSAMGVDADPTSGLNLAEKHLEQSGVPYAILRANWFMQNFHTYWIGSILATGELRLPVGDAKASFVDARDIAAVAATLLDRDDGERAVFELTGPEALDHAQAAAFMSTACGRPIRFRDVAPESLRPALIQSGLSAPYADSLLTLLGYLKAGHAERTTRAVEEVLGRPARRFADYARDHATAWAA